MPDIPSPFIDHGLHIGGDGAFKMHGLAGYGVYKAEFTGVQGMAGAKGKAVIYKLFVLGKHGAFYNAVAAIKIIIE